MAHYILQTVAFQLFFLITYDVFLKKETFFNWNRVYLLGTVLLSIVLPFVKVERLKNVVPQEFIINLPQVILGEQPSQDIVNNVIVQSSNQWSLISVESIVYIGIAMMTLFFTFKLIRLFLLIIKNPKRWKGNLLIINLINSNAAFSFFHYIFLGEYVKEEDRQTILDHETIHVKQKHTLDLLFFEVLRIVFWFNPLVYIYQKRIVTLHEYIADAKATQNLGKNTYYQNLLSQVFETTKVSFTNTFYKQSLIKKRIVMLSKAQSNRILKFKYLLLVPIVFGILLYTSCEQENLSIEETLSVEELNFIIPRDAEETPKTIEENNEFFNNMDNFLKNNPNYVKRITISPDKTTYTLHLKTEPVPEFYNELTDTRGGQEGRIYYLAFEGYSENEKFEREPLNLRDYDGREEVPFAAIDQVPSFPDCGTLGSNEEKRKCMSKKITELVRENFNTKLANDLGLIGRQRINVIFKIDTEGNITEVKSRAPHPGLQEEAERVVKSIPQMQPGKHNGEAVTVQYGLPIIFQVHE